MHKQKIILLSLFLFSVQALFGFSNKISSSISLPFSSEQINDNLNFSLNYTFENDKNIASIGIKKSPENISLYTDETFWFKNFYKTNDESEEYLFSRLGAKGFINVEYYNDLAVYHNLLCGLDSVFYFQHNLTFFATLLFDFSFNRVFLDDNQGLSFTWWDIQLKLALWYKLPVEKNIDIFLEMSNYTPYTLQRFYAPTFSLGSKYSFTNNFALTAQLDLHYLDIFCFSRYFDYAGITINGEYRFEK